MALLVGPHLKGIFEVRDFDTPTNHKGTARAMAGLTQWLLQAGAA